MATIGSLAVKISANAQALTAGLKGHEGQLRSFAGGIERPHPAVKILSNAERQYLTVAAAFGLTPASRSRLNIPDPDPAPDDPKSRFFRDC